MVVASPTPLFFQAAPSHRVIEKGSQNLRAALQIINCFE
jgi:hypothetical protein